MLFFSWTCANRLTDLRVAPCKYFCLSYLLSCLFVILFQLYVHCSFVGAKSLTCLTCLSFPTLILSLYPSLSLQMPNEGSLALVIILIVLQGVTGISFGLVISSAIDDEQSANQAALGIFYPNLIISGRLCWNGVYVWWTGSKPMCGLCGWIFGVKNTKNLMMPFLILYMVSEC